MPRHVSFKIMILFKRVTSGNIKKLRCFEHAFQAIVFMSLK